MAALRNILSIFALVCAVLAVTSGHVQHKSHQNRMRLRRQVVQDEVNQEPVDAIQENQGPEVAAPKNEVTALENEGSEVTALENEGSEVVAPDNQGSEDAAPQNQAADDNTEQEVVSWTTCNFGVDPYKSCYDCNSLLICKQVGGLVKRCMNPFRPYCNNGNCSPIPSAECA